MLTPTAADRVAGAVMRLKGMVINSNNPYLVVNTVLGMSFSTIGTWLYADKISIVENIPEPAIASRQSCALGTGYASLQVTAFNFL